MGNEWSGYRIPFAFYVSNLYVQHRDKEILPDTSQFPSYDPLLGFPNGRKERVMYATPNELESANLPLVFRDYCAHRLIDFMKCRRDKKTMKLNTDGCDMESHAWQMCEYEDKVLRMKEFEREKRLNRRKLRLARKTLEEE